MKAQPKQFRSFATACLVQVPGTTTYPNTWNLSFIWEDNSLDLQPVLNRTFFWSFE